MRIASRWAKTGSLKVLGDTQHPWQHVLRLGHIQATRRCRGMRDRAVWQAVWNSAVFRCISLYDAPYMYHASSRLPPGAIQPYSAIQRCMSIQLYSTIQHTPHTTPLSLTLSGASSALVSQKNASSSLTFTITHKQAKEAKFSRELHDISAASVVGLTHLLASRQLAYPRERTAAFWWAPRAAPRCSPRRPRRRSPQTAHSAPKSSPSASGASHECEASTPRLASAASKEASAGMASAAGGPI